MEQVLVDKEFLKQIVKVLDSKEYESIFIAAAIHGIKYTGDVIDMKKLRKLAGLEN